MIQQYCQRGRQAEVPQERSRLVLYANGIVNNPLDACNTKAIGHECARKIISSPGRACLRSLNVQGSERFNKVLRAVLVENSEQALTLLDWVAFARAMVAISL